MSEHNDTMKTGFYAIPLKCWVLLMLFKYIQRRCKWLYFLRISEVKL